MFSGIAPRFVRFLAVFLDPRPGHHGAAKSGRISTIAVDCYIAIRRRSRFLENYLFTEPLKVCYIALSGFTLEFRHHSGYAGWMLD
jgi:hypothetical protein